MFITLAFAILLFSSAAVYSIGVTPARKVITFEPDLKAELVQKAVNNDKKNMSIVIYARGELEKNIRIIDSLLKMAANEGTADFRYEVSLPHAFEKPGLHSAEIVLMELPKEFGSSEEATISAIGSVVSDFYVRVPFPDKYAEAKAIIETPSIDKPVRFVILASNYGNQKIVKAKATIAVLGATYEQIGEAATQEAEIGIGQQAQFIGEWSDATINPGLYHARITFEYDGKSITLEENFKVGDLSVEITDLRSDKFQLGSIAAIDIYLKNRWNSPIKNVYGILSATDREGTEYAKVTTAATDLETLGTGKLTAYWDTRDIPAGAYNLNVELHYEGRTTAKLIKANLNIDSLRTDFQPIGRVIVGPATQNRNTMLYLLILLLLGANIGWFVYMKRSMKGSMKKQTKK